MNTNASQSNLGKPLGEIQDIEDFHRFVCIFFGLWIFGDLGIQMNLFLGIHYNLHFFNIRGCIWYVFRIFSSHHEDQRHTNQVGSGAIHPAIAALVTFFSVAVIASEKQSTSALTGDSQAEG